MVYHHHGKPLSNIQQSLNSFEHLEIFSAKLYSGMDVFRKRATGGSGWARGWMDDSKPFLAHERADCCTGALTAPPWVLSTPIIPSEPRYNTTRILQPDSD